MTIEKVILAAIRTRQFMRINYLDQDGQICTDIIEGYTLGFNWSNQQILKGFHWASTPGPNFSTGERIYTVERILSVEAMEQRFDHPHDENAAKDSREFREIIGDSYFPAYLHSNQRRGEDCTC